MTQPTENLAPFYGKALVAAGVAIGLALLLIVGILTWGGWPEALFGTIIEILGRALMGGGVLLVLIIIFLGLGGPVRKLKALLGKITIETEGDA